MHRTLGLALVLVLVACGAKETSVAAKPATAFNPDSHLFLEEIEGKQALDWVKGENERTLKVLEAEPRYQGYYDEALKIATSKERIPYGSLRNGYVYNFWQDGEHVRGLWRRVKLADYAKAAPPWETILDVDALAKSENANWVYKGVSCLPPAYERCIVELSDGGKDAVRLREFDVATKSFVAGGFDIPEAKSDMTWKDLDTLLVSTDWGEADGRPTLTTSGYPFVIKSLKRGQALKDAVEVARGKESDVAASAYSIEDAERSSLVRCGRGAHFLHLGLLDLPGGRRRRDDDSATAEGDHSWRLRRHAAGHAGTGLDTGRPGCAQDRRPDRLLLERVPQGRQAAEGRTGPPAHRASGGAGHLHREGCGAGDALE